MDMFRLPLMDTYGHGWATINGSMDTQVIDRAVDIYGHV